ncbi:MAG: NUDIX domain-containing protein [Chlamydiae bacterium]|nr:NUDIX domain-containing protein [Chlamydiota bacterium]
MEKHFTATTYILQENKTLLIFHKKIKKWLPPGGHIEENETPAECAIREAKEETGIDVEIISQENLWLEFPNAKSIERPYLCLLENIPAHGQTPEHKHIDFIYVSRPLKTTLSATPKDHHEMRWFSIEDLLLLTPDEDIFTETLTTIQHLFSHFNLRLV